MADIALEQLLHTAGDNTLSTTDGALHGYMRGTDGTTTRTVKTDADGNIVISPGLGTEATLAAVKAVLDSLDGKDYATQATLAEVLAKLADPATATKQDAAKVVLDAISTAVAARATEATLAQIKTALTDGTLKAQLSGVIVDGAIETLGTKAQTWKTNPTSPMSIMEALKGIMTLMEDGTPGPSRLAQIQTLLADPATSAKQDAAKVVLDAISTAVAARATEATLAQIKTALTDGTLKAQLSGSLLERYGATEAQRPAANSVPVGAVYMAVQTQQMWQSDGSQWVVM